MDNCNSHDLTLHATLSDGPTAWAQRREETDPSLCYRMVRQLRLNAAQFRTRFILCQSVGATIGRMPLPPPYSAGSSSYRCPKVALENPTINPCGCLYGIASMRIGGRL